MDTVHYTTAQKQLEQTMDKVCEDRNHVVITRNNKPSVVIMSLEDCQSLAETAYLLRSIKNAQRLLESIAELEAGGGIKKELIE
ncbi:MAG TPA: type II toxin-antitoxin system prevent-host-death family antitoxin [Cyanobacteria bacterium UBA11149]|nr:type II toxin-antitoxin system prevent-host-death family antitoxin [Cyanobacteria bacterium UBA11367]HBE57869.1 type II toxin-antitoxin system prevent-host-death family antitoxin [Cyanobacteria bacterium UBA11366]HBK65477.1 type II toxin-antitoxin system prevent-host-death family antitoxin [Cyanobacteria bacterium UBA11166]HBR72474.1 type II toxin-antitoxin system prevent-host-death family antitoxin [Cyanobacteria bacterium UBA11159]HBS68255.1 type II toxin-antitoxin system prevent-host-deat